MRPSAVASTEPGPCARSYRALLRTPSTITSPDTRLTMPASGAAGVGAGAGVTRATVGATAGAGSSAEPVASIAIAAAAVHAAAPIHAMRLVGAIFGYLPLRFADDTSQWTFARTVSHDTSGTGAFLIAAYVTDDVRWMRSRVFAQRAHLPAWRSIAATSASASLPRHASAHLCGATCAITPRPPRAPCRTPCGRRTGACAR